jgi:hypothetical protein
MAIPTTRTEFKEHCLRRLGKPVIEINLDDDQMDDRIDDAIDYFRDYHFDGVERVFYSHALTQTDIDNKYLTVEQGSLSGVADKILGVTRLLHSDSSGSSMFDVQYQLRLNDIAGTFGSMGTSEMQYYWSRMSNLAMIEDMLDHEPTIRYNRLTNKLFIDWNWTTDAIVGEYVVLDAYRAVDPATFTEVYGDRLLRDYCTALFKEQWGMNLSKFEGVQLPGGVTLNGRAILDDARAEIALLKETVSLQYELPVDFYTG